MNNLLPNTLIDSINFNQLFNLKPSDRSDVIIYDKNSKEYKNKKIFRSYMCYLNTPDFDESTKKSYMFINQCSKVPDELQPFIEFAKSLDERYNQMVVNWYNPEDYIEMHSDCSAKFIDKNSPILTINLNETNNNPRDLIFENRETMEVSKTKLLNNTYFLITNNESHRHGVGTGLEKRISITFRMIKDLTNPKEEE